MRWNRKGDLNSKFFHKVVKGRARRKFIGVVNTNKGLVDSITEVKEAVWSFFKNKFTEPEEDESFLAAYNFKSLNLDEVIFQEAPFSDEEMKEAMWTCDRSTSPGPDGSTLFLSRDVGTF